ncbi:MULTISPECIES: class I SAM-dependent methyltransferase [unclassified Blastococcus]|uniref:class I SAM-dependent methyltransferase n=1 Tax=unclassified Blastococcus TaxID=2619396 RepID=UPI001EF0A641|nr:MULTISPECIES: methyltransferase domain-containing protein [unclassified Blastococcus]
MAPRRRAEAAPPTTERVRAVYERQAAHYDAVITVAEWLLFRGGRSWACRQVRGRVLEVGVGTGRNLPLFPPEVELTGIDLSPAMLARAEARAAQLARPADLCLGDAQRLPFPDSSFDSVIATLTLCSIPDDRAAVAEMARVLRPGGRLVLLDHVASPLPAIRRVQRLLEPAFLRLAADHLLREPEVAVRAAGLEIEHLRRSKLGIVMRLACTKP